MTSTDSSRLRRLKAEVDNARKPTQTNDVQVYTIDGVSSDNTIWHATIVPPQTSLYHGGKFRLVLSFPIDYPVKAPVVRFDTKIFHPNIDPETGDAFFCENGPEWCPVYTGNSLIRSIVADLDQPHLSTWKTEEPAVEPSAEPQQVSLVANWDAAELWRCNREEYETRVAEWLVMYAIDDAEDDGFVLV